MSKIKLTQEQLEYYLLQITHDTTLNDIDLKLHSLTTICNDSSLIVVDFIDYVELDKCNLLVLHIVDITDKLKLKLYAIRYNDKITTDNIYGVPVIVLPTTLNTKPIYNQTLIIDEPVRSGMKFENDGDIIITSFVSNNAEIVATGNIHVYGSARGRFVAGNSGNKQSRIFLNKIDAELISIAGCYRVMDEKLPIHLLNKSVMICLNETGKLLINVL